ncbi:alpha/beta fold hydrolase [Amycolatopsis methanolica]|uniref:Alpha/beta hydrolase fold protein n=1 Tax=Amycolatopsis methanolica 239 TaxID=1068978 RepID=A0A076MSG2_AMYME|nr:alpha/beta fold hydrolase [Amycolatopsis methanolica]AIJ21906.1 alpha/beta hydrolase fold protein [Amycolatopsis methanolica 239]
MNLERPWGRLYFLDEGAGPLVVLLHPLAESGEIWRGLIDRLTPHFRVVVPDARGHGGSSWDGTPFSVQDLATDVAALIKYLDAGPARVAGMSMGGCTAIALAVRHPALVANLVLADTTADYGPEKAAAWGERAEKAVSVPRDKQLAFQTDRWFSPGFRERNPAEVERVSRLFVATNSAAHAAACRALGSYEDSARLGAITAPTLVLVGEDDYATPPSMAEALHRGIADSKLHVFRGTRHLSLIESPQAQELTVEHFIGSCCG